MTNAGKARYVENEEDINTLKKYLKNPLILAKVQISTWRYVDHILKTAYTTICTDAK